MNEILKFMSAGAFALVALNAGSQVPPDKEITVGAIRDKIEASGVRFLLKLSDKLSLSEELISPEKQTFYTVSRQFTINATDKSKFNGLVFRYGLVAYNVPIKSVELGGKNVLKTDLTGLWHVFPISIGADTDRNARNTDVLLEVGYIPMKLNDGNCFKLGLNPIIGIVGQLGRSNRNPSTEAATTASNSESQALRRIKAEAKVDFPMGCLLNFKQADAEPAKERLIGALFADISSWRISGSAAQWRDFVVDKTYRRSEVKIRIPTGDATFIDLTRESGTGAPNFVTGSQFSANLTVAF